MDAIGVTRKQCWRYDWVLEFDIKGLFDNIDHTLLLRAVEMHVKCGWAILYIKRWLTAPLQHADGTLLERTQGTPQGGVVSPILANLFLHYTFDVWMTKMFPGNPWCRYADDGLVHCRTESQALAIESALDERFAECHLEMHPEKTKIAYCKDSSRRKDYPITEFDFLGYTFRPRKALNRKRKSLFINFTPAVSNNAVKAMRHRTRKLNYRNRTELSLAEISQYYNPVLRGWLTYYGKFSRSAMYPVFRHFNKTLVAWAMKKYKS